MKSYQFFKIYKRFHKEKEHTTHTHTTVNEKRKLRKVGHALEQNIFYSHLKYQSFFFNRSFCSRFFILQPFFDT